MYVKQRQNMQQNVLAVKRQDSASTAAFEARLARVNMAPFERPVVPDV